MTHFKGEQKIADQVVYEGDVENVEINDEVIRTYCEVIGIDYDSEKDLLWIAEEGMRAPIPKPWKACRDTNSDELYYFNFQTGESQWDHPLDEFFSKKVTDEREKLKNRSRVTPNRSLSDHQNPLESRTQPFTVSTSGQSRSHSNLANTLPPDARINSPNYSSPSPVKEDGKRFLKSSKKSSDEEGYGGGGAREERLMFDLDDQIGAPGTQHGAPPRQESSAYEDDYEEDVDFGDGEDRHLSVLLEKESTIEPELANLASTGEHETGTSQFSHAVGDTAAEPQTSTSGPAIRPRNPLAESTRVGQSMTATSFDASENIAQRDPAELESRLKTELHNVQLELLEEHDAKIRQLKSEIDDQYAKEETQLKQQAAERIQKIKLEIAAEIEKEAALKNEKTRATEAAELEFEEEMHKEIEELRSKTSKAIASEKKILENREEEVTKRLVSARADMVGEVDRRLGAERAVLEGEYAARVAVLRKELADLHESEMAKLRTDLEEANYREQEAKRAEVRAAEQRVSSVRVLESEMGVSLDRRRAELREEHEQILSQLRRDQERAITAAKQEVELEISKARAEANELLEDTRRKISEETDRQLVEAKADGERARQTALARITGLEDSLRTREDRIAKRQRELDELERRLNEKERQLKGKQDDLKLLSEELAKEDANVATQKAALEKKRAEFTGIQRSIAVDEMINRHSSKNEKSLKGNAHKHVSQADDSHSTKSIESSKDSSSKRGKLLKKAHDKDHSRHHNEDESGAEEVEEEISSSDAEEEDPTTVEQMLTASGPKRPQKGKDKPPRLADLLPMSSCSSDDDGSGLGHNGHRVRKMLLNLLFPNDKQTNGDDENAAHGHTSTSTSSRHSKNRKEEASKVDKRLANILNPPLFKVDLSDDEDSDLDLNEIRSRIRSERLRAIQADQHSLLHGTGIEQIASVAKLPNDSVAYTSYAGDNRSYSLYNSRASVPDVDRYLAARWYQLYRGSAYTSPLRSQNSWQWPLSSSTKYGYVPARELLTQYSANRLASPSNATYRPAEKTALLDMSRLVVSK